jgi:hypothetical protein
LVFKSDSCQKPARQGGSTREHLAWGAIKGNLRQRPSLTVGLLTLYLALTTSFNPPKRRLRC